MNENQVSQKTVTAGAGTVAEPAAVNVAAADVNESEKSCHTAGNKDTQMSTTESDDEKVATVKTADETPTAATAPQTCTPGDEAKAEGGKDGAKKKKQKLPPSPHEIMIPFDRIVVSKWNESYDSARNEDNVKDLAKDIARHGLMHAVTLASNKKEDGGLKYTVLAGWRRIEALKHLRGGDSGLRLNEFKIHDKLDESCDKCLDYSLSENARRYGRSTLDSARFYGRMVKEIGIKETRLALRCNVRREVINRLVKLYECRSQLPQCWLKDLDCQPKPGTKKLRKEELPRITLTHWIEVAGRIKAASIDEKVTVMLKTAYDDKWSVSKLRERMREMFPEPATEHKGQANEKHKTPRKQKPITREQILKLTERLMARGVPAGDEQLLHLKSTLEGMRNDEAEKAAREAAVKATESGAAEKGQAVETATVTGTVAGASGDATDEVKKVA